MPHILVAGRLHPSGKAQLASATAEDETLSYEHIENEDPHGFVHALPRADALVLRTQPLTKELIDSAKTLQIVSRHGVGYDAVDVAALNARRIPLAIVGDVNSRSVAEHTMTLLLAASRRLLKQDAACRGSLNWGYRNALEGRDVHNKCLLIVGYGRIGRHLARMATGFEIEVIIYDSFLAADADLNGVTRCNTLQEALARADFVSLHLPRTDTPVLGVNEIAQLKPDAVVLNAARGGLIDDVALANALKEGKLLGAGLDVFTKEPLTPDHLYNEIDTAILTPHSAGMSRESAERMAISCLQNVLDHFSNTLNPALVVNAQDIAYGK